MADWYPEVVYCEWFSILPSLDLAAHTADLTGTSWIYISKCGILVMIHAAIFVGIDLDIFLPSGELKPGIAHIFPGSILRELPTGYSLV